MAGDSAAVEPERGNWGGKLDFFMSCVGYAVGLGNVWRFPYLCFRNGGGAFLVPYVIMLALAGLPMFFFEMALGQFASLGPITIWRVNPLFMGIGFAVVIICTMVCVYYNVIIMYSMFYLMVSIINLDGNLPWMSCGNYWNTPACTMSARPSFDNITDVEKLNITMRHLEPDCVNTTLSRMNLNYSDLTYNLTLSNFTACNDTKSWRLITPSEEYWTNFVLNIDQAEDLGNVGGVSLKLAFVLLLSWLVLFFCLKKGVQTSGKVVYFMATFPYIVLICLLVRGLTLDGHMLGVNFYIIPKWERLLDATVWREAATQIFFSLGPGFGSLMTMASYNPFKHNCHRDAVIVSLINCGTSVFAGFVIFSMLGFMAHTTNQDVKDVAVDGPGLVFVVYPEGIARMPVAPLWSFLFFFMLVALGLDSQFGMMESVLSAIIDAFPAFLRRHRTIFTLCCVHTKHHLQQLLQLLSVLPLLVPQRQLSLHYTYTYIALVIRIYTLSALGPYVLSVIHMLSVVAGLRRFCRDVELMMGFQPNYYWQATWLVITPLAIVVMIVMSFVQYSPSYYGDYKFPAWGQDVGWVMVSVPIACIFVTMVIQIIRHGSVRNAIKPKDSWGPAKLAHRTGRYASTNPAFQSDGETEAKNGSVVNSDIEMAVDGDILEGTEGKTRL
ncbi:sodium-dependent proline transporter-like [Haliotis rubra]|uniref:sodium-dependent proline transporter-like n=1 Tax=Haliotis rubra TaxID=36100 RepID=UPI001EE4F212|nr:sodium-dependent proline transporter-like [Haliotis rubra]